MTTNLAQATMDNGVVLPSLAPLLQRLKLPFEYTVLAACMDPEDKGRCFALVVKHPAGNDPQPYVVYRVDPTDGSCHGGHYCGSLERAFSALGERLETLRFAAGERETAERDFVARGYHYGQSSDQLPAHSAQSDFYADHAAYRQ